MVLGRRTPPGGTETPADTAFEAGVKALSDADWARACLSFKDAITQQPDSAEAWEGLAAAAWWVPDEETIFEARERAYQLYRERSASDDAARMASWLAMDSLELRGQDALANGWMQRAQRLLEGHRDSPANAWVTLLHARLLMLSGEDGVKVRRMASRAAALARRLTLPDVEALSLSLEGLARLNIGDVSRAIHCLDEAAAIVLGGEARDITAAGLTLCQLMAACERIRDFDRARQWCAAARQFSEDRGFPVILSICRPHYAAVLMWRGHWPEAEEHLEIGRRELMEFMPPFAVGAISLLAGLRWRQGRWDDAQQLLEQVKTEPAAQFGLAELAAGQGDLEHAIDLLKRRLRGVPEADGLERGPALELLVRCLAAGGRTAEAEEPLQELRAVAEHVQTDALRASAALAEGALAGAKDEWEVSQQCMGDAVQLFERSGAPFEAAHARVALAESLAAGRRFDAAAREALIAEETLRRVGAPKEAERAANLLASIKAQRTSVSKPSPDGLTTREREVLNLLSQGRSNQQIAADLVLSVRTVERHISNIYMKLELEGRTARTAAAAYVHRLLAR